MQEVAVLGVGMHPFGKYLDKTLKDLAEEAVLAAVDDAGIELQDIQAAFFSNAMAGLITGQESVRGQVVLRHIGLGGIPVVNVENACASASTAFREAWMSVASGMYDVALAVGVEKLYCGDTARSIQALASATDVDLLGKMGIQFTAVYAMRLRNYMERYGATPHHLALTVVKNSRNGSLNPYAQFRRPLTEEEVLNSRMIAYPLTLYMCSSMGDGAAAAVLTSLEYARRHPNNKPLVRVAATVLRSGIYRAPGDTLPPSITLAADEAYTRAGVGPEDVEVAEVHDAMSPAEMLICEELRFCPEGHGFRILEEGVTAIEGRLPVNPSGGLAARGHPVGATGLAQIAEIVWQLRGEAGARQVRGRYSDTPRVGLIENAGGHVDGDSAALAIHILKR